jgi:ABC-type transport system involved in multi-copper enzyme maturation permease subunit
MKENSIFEARVIAAKELTQLANRKAFHAGKAAFAVVIVTVFLVLSFSVTHGWLMDVTQMGGFGRATFVPVSVYACIILSAMSLIASSGIVMSEAVGKRLDILRITPLSLRTIVLGKGLAVLARSVLIMALLMPILAATQLFGGVSTRDVATSALLTLTDVFFLTGLGLAISAGARSTTDRVIRSGEVLFLWIAGTYAVSGLAFFLEHAVFGVAGRGAGPALDFVVALSPFFVWQLHFMAELSWTGLASNMALHIGAGLFLMRYAVRSLERTVVSAEVGPSEPRVKDVMAGLGRAAKGHKGFKTIGAQRQWAGTLIGGQVTQSSLVAILLPLAAGLPQIVMFLLNLSGNGRLADEYPAFISATLGVMIVAMVAIQACGTIAREKTRHTADTLAATPAGGWGMIWWKGAAVGIAQSFTALLCLAFVIASTYKSSDSLWIALLNGVGFLALLVFIYCLGASFSLSSRSPMEAFGLMVATVVVLSPILFQLMSTYLWGALWADPQPAARYRGPVTYGNGAAVVLFVVGAAILVLRNAFPRFSKVVLCAGVALALAAPTPLYGVSVNTPTIGFMMAPLVDVVSQHSRHYPEILGLSIALELVLSAVLVSGAYVKFNAVFLHGSKPKG